MYITLSFKKYLHNPCFFHVLGMTCPDQNWINISQNCHYVTSGSWCFESSIYFVPIFFTYPSFHCLFFEKYNEIREISCSIYLSRNHLVLSSVPAHWHWRNVAWDIPLFKYLDQWQHSLAILTAVIYRYWQNLPGKLGQQSDICWNSLGLFRDYGLNYIFF